MLPSRPSILCLKAYESDVEPCMSNRKSPHGMLEAQPSCFFLTAGTQENVHSCTHHECRQPRMRCRTPPYFSENLCSTHYNDFRVPESQQQPLVRVRAASEDRRGSHTCQEGPYTEAQQRLPCVFVRANQETGMSSHPSTTDFQASNLCQTSVSVRNRLDYASAPCHCCEGKQSSLQCHHAPCVRIRSPTGDHRIPTRVAERIQAFYPSPPPPPPPPLPPTSSHLHLVDQRDPLPLEGHHQCGLGRHLCWARPLPEPVSNIQSSSEPMHVHLQHQPSLTSFMTSPALPPNELHQSDCPLNAAHPSVSYLWVKSSSNEQQEHLPGLESHRRFEQEKPSYMWMRNTPRARSEIHAGMVRPPLVTQRQPQVRNSSEGQKNCLSPEGRPPALEHLPAFILIRNKTEVNPCTESIAVPGRGSSPIACNNLTWNNKPSSSSESLQSEYQNQSPSTSPKGPLPFLPSAEGENDQPVYGSRNSFPDDPIKTSPIMQDFRDALPSIYLLVRNTDKVPTTCLPQDGAKTQTESSRTMNLRHLPFAGPFSEGETYCKLERLGTVVQEPTPCRDLLEEERAQAGPPVDDISLLFSAPQNIEMDKNPPPSSLFNMCKNKDPYFPTAERHQQSCLDSDNMNGYLNRAIPRSDVPPTLLQSHLPFPSGEVTSEHQKEVYCMLHSSRSMCEQQPTASVFPSNPKLQNEHVHFATKEKIKQDAPPPRAPTSSPVTRASPTLQITQCSLLDASENKNNSSPRTPCPDLEEDQAPYLLVQNILQNCESRTVSPCLWEAAHGQPPHMILGPTPEGKKTANSDPLHASGEHNAPHTVKRTGPVDQNLLYASCSSSQSCLIDQPPANSDQIPSKVFSEVNCNPDVHCLDKPQTPGIEYDRQAGEPGRSCRAHLSSQPCQTDEAPVQSIPEEVGETNSSVERSPASTNQQPSLPGSLLSPEDHYKPMCSSEAEPCVVPMRPISARDNELTSGNALPHAESHSSPFMYFQVLRPNRHSTGHCPNQLLDQSGVRPCPLPVPRDSTGSRDVTSQHLQPRQIVQLSYHKASIRRLVVQCQMPQQSLGTISEDESELCKSSDGSCQDGEHTGAKQQLHNDKQGYDSAPHSQWGMHSPTPRQYELTI